MTWTPNETILTDGDGVYLYLGPGKQPGTIAVEVIDHLAYYDGETFATEPRSRYSEKERELTALEAMGALDEWVTGTGLSPIESQVVALNTFICTSVEAIDANITLADLRTAATLQGGNLRYESWEWHYDRHETTVEDRCYLAANLCRAALKIRKERANESQQH